MQILNWIQNWYKEQCDGNWEHDFGIKIGTLGNPGWMVTIDLTDTPMHDLEIPYKLFETADDDWYGYAVRTTQFEGCGDPSKLEKILLIFKELAENYCATVSAKSPDFEEF